LAPPPSYPSCMHAVALVPACMLALAIGSLLRQAMPAPSILFGWYYLAPTLRTDEEWIAFSMCLLHKYWAHVLLNGFRCACCDSATGFTPLAHLVSRCGGRSGAMIHSPEMALSNMARKWPSPLQYFAHRYGFKNHLTVAQLLFPHLVPVMDGFLRVFLTSVASCLWLCFDTVE
jgi:hypothetical protein